jgi:hypothetical protein
MKFSVKGLALAARSAAFPDLRHFCLCQRPAGSSFRGKRGQTSGCRMVDCPLPLNLTNAAFMKPHRVFVMSYATGWLVKLVIVAVAIGWFLH